MVGILMKKNSKPRDVIVWGGLVRNCLITVLNGTFKIVFMIVMVCVLP